MTFFLSFDILVLSLDRSIKIRHKLINSEATMSYFMGTQYIHKQLPNTDVIPEPVNICDLICIKNYRFFSNRSDGSFCNWHSGKIRCIKVRHSIKLDTV